MASIRDAIARLVELMVDEPDEVTVEEFEEPDAVVFELQVAPRDLGKVIGRQGRTARALRALLAARGAREGERYELEILES